jgi:phage major head subunit gpT-like protein
MATPGGNSLDISKIQAARTAYYAIARKRMTETGTFHPKVATVATTGKDVSVSLWLSRHPRLRKWVSGPKLKKKFRIGSDRITTEPYEASVAVPVDDIEHDDFGMWSAAIGNMGQAYPEALDKLAADVLNGAFGTTYGTSYDGQNLIDTDHTTIAGGASQSNLVTGALSATTLDLAFRRFGEFVDEEGQPMTRKPATLTVGYQNREVARKLLGQDALASGETNMNKGILSLEISPFITGTNWFVTVADSAAIVIHVKKKPLFLAVDDPNGIHRFETGEHLYGIEAEFGAKPGMWEDIVGGTGS